jgi:death-on-curing protein
VSFQQPIFLSKYQVLKCHGEQLRRFGGRDGIRDEGLLDSAIVAPQHTYCYDESADIFDLSSQLLYSLAMNHPFIDGNKRAATQSAIAFLNMNGWSVDTAPIFLTLVVEKLVIGSCDRNFIADFLFLSCRNEERFFDVNIPPHESYKLARTEEERHAILVDIITSTFRARVLEICSKSIVKPERYDRMSHLLEDTFFSSVERHWRSQFGMGH